MEEQYEAGIQEEEFSRKLDAGLWKKIWKFAQPYTRELSIMVLCNLVIAGGEIAFPLLNRYAVDTIVRNNDTGGLWGFVGILAIMAFVLTAAVLTFIIMAGKIEQHMCHDIRMACFDRLQQLSFSYYDQTPVGYIMARMTSDINRLAETIAWALIDVIWAVFIMVGTSIAMLYMNVQIALVVLLIVPPLAIATVFFQRKIFKLQRRARRLNSRITSAFNESIMGATTTKTLVREEESLKEFSDLTHENKWVTTKSARLSAIFMPIVVLLGSTGMALALWRGGILVQEGVLWFGTLSAFATYTGIFFEPMQQLARIFAEMQTAQASAERVIKLLETEPSITDSPEIVESEGDVLHPIKDSWPKIHGNIEFKDIYFHYKEDEPILECFNLTADSGQTIALVGETGSGKSTIVNIACRFYEPQKGEVLIDGVDYRQHSQLWLQSNIGYVLQSPHLFSGTVADNIRYGRHEATMRQIESAAKLVSADAFIQRLEQGYNTQVGQGGGLLSTGEKQLISFARAVLTDPPIFVLDEATSSIDTETEQLIQQAITATLKGRTSFIIAHRLSTIRQADSIIVLRGGKIVEQGRHGHLIRQGGYYKSLYSNQFLQEQQDRLLSGEDI